MSKKHDTSNKGTKDGKLKRHCTSKKTTGKTWERPVGYYGEYERKRRGEGKTTRLQIKALAAILLEIYPPTTSSEARMIPYMVCLADKEFRCHSYRRHVSYLETHQGTLSMYGLKTVPSKSCLHHAATLIAEYDGLHEIIERQAGAHARGSLLGDATGISLNRYAEWEDAKRGLISRREFVKLHLMTDARGKKIVSCVVTHGRAHDSPVFREMIKSVPDGTGCVMLDAGYDANKNYKMICNTGRRPVICTRKNHVVRGFGPRAKMLRWQKRNPEEFEEMYHQRSIVESVFSSFKCRFTAVVRAKSLPTQRLQLLLRCVCYNLLS